MTDENIERYKNTRLAELLSFYDRRAIANKRGYRICSLFVIVVSALLTPLISTGAFEKHRITGGLISATIVVASAIMAHFKFHENWLSYRRTWDALKREVAMHTARISPYNEADFRNCVLVERIEALVAAEGESWATRHAPNKSAGENRPDNC